MVHQTNTQSHAPDHPDTPYLGLQPDKLPRYMQERLAKFFEAVEDAHQRAEQHGTALPWRVKIDVSKSIHTAPHEWTEWQVDDGLPPVFHPENYGYSDGICDYAVSIVTPTNGHPALAESVQRFSFLKTDELEFRRDTEEIGIYASYRICRSERSLK